MHLAKDRVWFRCNKQSCYEPWHAWQLLAFLTVWCHSLNRGSGRCKVSPHRTMPILKQDLNPRFQCLNGQVSRPTARGYCQTIETSIFYLTASRYLLVNHREEFLGLSKPKLQCYFSAANSHCLALWSITLLGKLTVAQLFSKFCAFTEHEGSLTCSQQTANGPYPSSPRSNIVPLQPQVTQVTKAVP
jgi:hypothetical protein